MVRKLLLILLLPLFSAGLFYCDFGGGGGDDDDDGDTSTAASWPTLSFSLFASGFNSPLGIETAGDGSNRLFVVERGGRIWIIKNGGATGTPFLDVTDRIDSSSSEMGLLGLAFPPNYGGKGYFYTNHTRGSDGSTVIARYYITADPDVADPNSEEVILTQSQPYKNHNAGQLAFGPDGYLYIGFGDGGSAGDPDGNAQNPSTFLGKMLRIDVESGGASPYGVPSDNPFTGNPGTLDEVWALGLRNPWRYSFDSLTGDLYIADVGQSEYEEVNFQSASSRGGENYGWDTMEGNHCYSSATCDQTGLTMPVHEYDHSEGDCSITGGILYRGTHHPDLVGIYIFGDFCTGKIWGLRNDGSGWESTLFGDTSYQITTFGQDETGELYLTDYSTGEIYAISTD
jgi:glucose/arabinose dehydrogenase